MMYFTKINITNDKTCRQQQYFTQSNNFQITVKTIIKINLSYFYSAPLVLYAKQNSVYLHKGILTIKELNCD